MQDLVGTSKLAGAVVDPDEAYAVRNIANSPQGNMADDDAIRA